MKFQGLIGQLIRIFLIILGFIITLVAIATILNYLGASSPISTGAAIIGAAAAVFGVLYSGSGSEEKVIEKQTTVPPRPPGGSQAQSEKETSPSKANFPERSAWLLRSLTKIGVSYGGLRKLVLIITTLSLVLFSLFGVGIVTPFIDGIAAPPVFQTISNFILVRFGVEFVSYATGVTLIITMLSFTLYVQLGNVHEKATCPDCDTDFCLSFDYVRYNPETQEEVTGPQKNDDGKTVGTEVRGYNYKGTLLATCTERDETVEREDWNWYVPTGSSQSWW